MNMIAWVVAGGAMGWLASLLMKTDAPKSVLTDVLVGATGAFIGGYLFGPMLGGTAINAPGFGVTPFVVSVFGAVILLIVARMLRRAGTQ
jgi:uncharacterized membrane protein YeaQ/YmgE (transglycosylase-associated protein family)